MANTIFDSHRNFTPSNGHQGDTLASLAMLARHSYDQKYKGQLSRQADAQIRDKQLFNLKENIPEIHATTRRPFMGLCCQSCTFTSRVSLVKTTTEKLALINILNRPMSVENHGFLSRIFPDISQVFQLKKYSYPQVADLVLQEERVKTAIERASLRQFEDSDSSDNELYQELYKRCQKRAKQLLGNMRSTLSDGLLRFTSWILYKLLPCFLSAVVVHPGQVNMLQESTSRNLPLIFLPLHRSHLDYILLSFILLNNNIRSPLVAAGDNLRIPFFGSLLRELGAFFIKRRIDPVMGYKDCVYKAILHTYMNLCLRAGHNIELFLEGGRTRTGKPCMPKYGLLSVIVETFMDGTIEDALLVPVSISYERLVDGNFVKEQLGEPKTKETFCSALKGIWHVLNSNFGIMRVDFSQPFSLRELIKTFEMHKQIPKQIDCSRVLKSIPSTTSLYGTDIVSDEHKTLVENISKHVIYDCAQSAAIMSTNALAFLLLTKYRTGASLKQLANALEDLKKELEFAGRDVGFSGDPVDVINYAVDLLGPALVNKKKLNGDDIIKPVVVLPNVIELSYYSNSLVAHFAVESVIALALCVAEIRFDTVSYDDLIISALELCDIFQYEFLFCKPCQDLSQAIISSIDDLTVKNAIFITEEDSELAQKSKKLATQFDDDEHEPTFQKMYKINANEVTLQYIQFLANIIMPFVETYAISAFTLDKLVGRQLLECELIDYVLHEMKSQLSRGSLKYDEGVAVDSIKNALKLFQKWGILECHNTNQLRLYYLKESCDDTESVRELYDRINKYRTNKLLCRP